MTRSSNNKLIKTDAELLQIIQEAVDCIDKSVSHFQTTGYNVRKFENYKEILEHDLRLEDKFNSLMHKHGACLITVLNNLKNKTQITKADFDTELNNYTEQIGNMPVKNLTIIIPNKYQFWGY